MESTADIPHAQPSEAPPMPEDARWRPYFERLYTDAPRFRVGVDFLRGDFAATMRRLIPADAAVLEVGVGAGDTLAALPNTVRHGIDFTPAALDRARAEHPELTVSEGDALTFTSEQRYDAIICDRMVHTVPDVQRLLENLAAHLRPGGRVFLSCFNFAWEYPLALAEATGFKLPAPVGNWFSEVDLANLFGLAGLEVVKYEDRVLVPAEVPWVGRLANRYLAALPGLSRLCLYRVYVLRRVADSAAKKRPAVSVVVPARNEAGNVPAILSRTPVMGERTELIFVEGNSTDNTWDAIGEAMATYKGPLQLSRHKQRTKGKGDAVRVGFEEATGDLLMILDADLTVPPEDLPKFYDAAVRGVADYLHGTRLVYPMEDEAMRFLNRLGNIGFSRLFTFLLNQPIKDTLCGTKVLWSDDYKRLAANRAYFGDFDPFGDFDLIFGAAKLNLKIVEIPIRYRSRTYGTTNISRFRHGWLLLKMSTVAARKLKFV